MNLITARDSGAAVCLLLVGLMTAGLAIVAPTHSQPPAGTAWTVNADLVKVTTRTMSGLGAMQGVSFRDGKFYLFGDVWDAKPRVGVIREYTTDYEPTGRVVWLRRDGAVLLRHPTGLTWHSRWGAFLGDTVNRKAIIYRFDWEQAWKDGDLSHAVLDIIDDDAAVNGCRPEFVSLNGRDYLATADYGDARPEVRLYDPEALVKAKRSSAPGVVAHRVLCGPFNQSLHWDSTRGQLTCVQNAINGRGWRLEVFDLARAVADGRSTGPGVRVREQTFSPRDELEGYRPLGERRGLFVTSSLKDNLVVAEILEQGDRERTPGQ
jgi:hypothetical protein